MNHKNGGIREHRERDAWKEVKDSPWLGLLYMVGIRDIRALIMNGICLFHPLFLPVSFTNFDVLLLVATYRGFLCLPDEEWRIFSFSLCNGFLYPARIASLKRTWMFTHRSSSCLLLALNLLQPATPLIFITSLCSSLFLNPVVQSLPFIQGFLVHSILMWLFMWVALSLSTSLLFFLLWLLFIFCFFSTFFCVSQLFFYCPILFPY